MSKGRRSTGAQTLARGISALLEVVEAPDGLSVQEVADRIEVHRTIAYRMLITLADAGLLVKGADAKYRGSVGLMRLQPATYAALSHAVRPTLERLAEEVEATVTFLVAEGDRAVALLAQMPRGAKFQLSFSQGDTHSLKLAAGGKALRSIMPEFDSDPSLDSVRRDGYAITRGEVEPDAWGVAVPFHVLGGVAVCLNAITHREDVARASIEILKRAARDLEAELREQS